MTVTVECDNCGSTFERYPSKVKDRNFCDESCYGKWKKESVSGENNPKWKEYVEKSCTVCEEAFSVKPSEADNRVTCSYECAAVWFSDSFSGEGNPRWSGGYDSYYGTEWHDCRRLMLEMHESCQNCGSTEDLHVHHIQPVRTYDDPTNAHHPENLAVVCQQCHPTVEAMEASEQKEMFK